MRNGLLALVSLAIGVNIASANDWAEKMFVKDNAPHLAHDFGVVPGWERLHHAFPVTNIYDVPIEISDVRRYSPVVAVSVERTKLAPHESTVINVDMDACRFRGQKTVCIWVRFGPNDSSTAMLTVSANVRPEVVCEPEWVRFDSVVCGQTPSRTVNVDYAGKSAWQITKATTPDGAPVDATVKETYRRPGEVGYQVTVTLKAGAAPGSFRESIVLETNDPNAARLELPVEGMVEDIVQCSPKVVSVGQVKVGKAVSRRVLVRGNKPFRVLSLDGPEGVKLEGQSNMLATPFRTVLFQLQPEQPGAFRYEIKIKTDLQDAPLIVVVDGVAMP